MVIIDGRKSQRASPLLPRLLFFPAVVVCVFCVSQFPVVVVVVVVGVGNGDGRKALFLVAAAAELPLFFFLSFFIYLGPFFWSGRFGRF
jgi:hypothetical protein